MCSALAAEKSRQSRRGTPPWDSVPRRSWRVLKRILTGVGSRANMGGGAAGSQSTEFFGGVLLQRTKASESVAGGEAGPREVLL